MDSMTENSNIGSNRVLTLLKFLIFQKMTKSEVINYMKNFKNEMPEKFYCENFTNIEEE